MAGPRLLRPPEKWKPKRWRPEYEVIVSLSNTGMSHQAVADRFFELSGTRYTVQHISNIVNTPEAKAFSEQCIAKIRGDFQETVSDRIAKAQQRALDRIENVLNNDDIFEASPFAVVDRSLRLLQLSKHSTGGEGGQIANTINNNFLLTADAAKIIREGTDKADEVARLYSGDVSVKES